MGRKVSGLSQGYGSGIADVVLTRLRPATQFKEKDGDSMKSFLIKINKSFSTFLIILITIFLHPNDCLSAPPNNLREYSFTCYFNGKNGDSYSGEVFAPANYGYSVGYTKVIKDENGK